MISRLVLFDANGVEWVVTLRDGYVVELDIVEESVGVRNFYDVREALKWLNDEGYMEK